MKRPPLALASHLLIGIWLLLTPARAETPAAAQVSSAVLHDEVVFSLTATEGQTDVAQRTKAATKALQQALKAGASETRIEYRDGAAVVFVAQIPIIQLHAQDALREGDASLDVLAARVAAQVRESLEAELRRVQIANWVFSFSLVVFLGLVTLYLLRKSAALITRARTWLNETPGAVPALQVQSFELVSASTLRPLLLLALSGGKWLARAVLVYAYLLVVSSMFEATRGYAEKLTGIVLSPVSVMMTRVASSVPGLIIALVVLALLMLVLRFISLFFAEVARGEAAVAGLPRDLAPATSKLLRFAVVFLALVFLGPIVTGSDHGALSELGRALMLGLVLAAVPLVTTVLLGAQLLFERRVLVGQVVSVGDLSGAVESVGFLTLNLRLSDGRLAYIPHLIRLARPMTIEAGSASWVRTILVPAQLPQARVRQILLDCLLTHGAEAQAQLVSLDLTQAAYRVSVSPHAGYARDELLFTLTCALQDSLLQEPSA